MAIIFYWRRICPNYAAAYKVTSINTLAGMLPTQSAALLSAFDPGQAPNQIHGIFPQTALINYIRHHRFFDYVGVRYLVVRAGLIPVKATTGEIAPQLASELGSELLLHKVFKDPRAPVEIWQSDSARPFAFLAQRVEAVRNWQNAQAKFEEQDPLITAFVEEPTETCASASAPASADGKVSRLSVSIEPNNIWLSLRSPRAGLLEITETFAAGWRASVNGAAQKIIRVNGAFQGICLPAAGDYSIRLTYSPPLLSISLWFAGLGAFLALLAIVFAYVRPRFGSFS